MEKQFSENHENKYPPDQELLSMLQQRIGDEVDLRSEPATELSESDKTQMLDITRRNYKGNPILPINHSGLENAFKSSDSEFTIVKEGEKIVAFVRFEDRGDKIYFGNFHVISELQGQGIGTLLLESTLDKKAKEKRVVAGVDIDSPITAKYINDFGFIVRTILPDFKRTGVDLFWISREDKVNNKYAGQQKNITDDKILEDSHGKEFHERPKMFIYRFDLKKDKDQFVKFAKEVLLEKEYVISRFFVDPKDGKQVCLFEKIITEQSPV